MKEYLKEVKSYPEKLKEIKELLLTNIVLIGQAPSKPLPDGSVKRVEVFTERMSGFSVDECTVDNYGNPIGIIKGEALGKPPIVLVAHMDTVFQEETSDAHFTVAEDRVEGPGILDNSLGAAILLSIPEVLKKLGLKFQSDIVLVGLVESIGMSNLKSIRSLLSTWQSPIRGAVCLEGGELGRLNYYSRSMRRAEIRCHVPDWGINPYDAYRQNSVLIINEVINQILKIRIPQRPRTEVVFGTVSGGRKHGESAATARLGFEVQSDSEKIVNDVFEKIKNIVEGKSHERRVALDIKEISDINAARLDYSHPLIKNTVDILKDLEVEPIIQSSESELSIFLAKKIPAVTLGIAHGENYHLEDASFEIESMFKGISQIVGVIKAIDEGVCDE